MSIKYKTFEDLGLTFTDDGCVTCTEMGECHSNILSAEDGQEYNVHISCDEPRTDITITISYLEGNEVKDEISFDNEQKAIEYLCKTFPSFRCF